MLYLLESDEAVCGKFPDEQTHQGVEHVGVSGVNRVKFEIFLFVVVLLYVEMFSKSAMSNSNTHLDGEVEAFPRGAQKVLK